MTDAYDPTCVLNMPGMYPFTDGATRKVRDFSGYGNHGAETLFTGDDSEYVDRGGRQGIVFTPVTKLLDCGTPAIMDFTSQPFSIEAWVLNADVVGGSIQLFRRYTFNVSGFYFGIDSGRTIIARTFQGGANQQTISSVYTREDIMSIRQIVCTRIGSSIKLFRDGTEVTYGASAVHVNPVSASATSLQLFTAVISLVGIGIKVWTRTLGASEVHDRFIKGMNGLL